MWYLATLTSICNASSRRAATASRVAVEPKLDIARYHMIGPSIKLMNFSAVTIFLARVVFQVPDRWWKEWNRPHYITKPAVKAHVHGAIMAYLCTRHCICIGYRLRWRSDSWRTDRGVAEVRSPGIRPATDDDIRHNAPGLLETVDQLLRTKVRRKLLNQDKPSRLASYALQQHKAKSARLAASEFFSSLPFWDALGGCVQWSRRETKTLKLQQATEELGREWTARVTTMAWCLTL